MKKQVGAVLAGTAAVGILATVTFGLAGQVGARPVTTDVAASRTVHRDGDRADHLAPIASVLGMTVDELQSALHSGQSLAGVATSTGIAVQTVVDAVVAEMKSHIASEVASGELTQAEADAKLADVVAKATEIVNGIRPEGVGRDRGFERGPRGPGLDSIASVLAMTVDELQSALRSGQSLAVIATSKGVAVQTVVDAVVAEMKSHIASEVASGELMQTEADAKLADVIAKATEIVNGTLGKDFPGHHRGGHDERGPARGRHGNIQPSAMVTETNA